MCFTQGAAGRPMEALTFGVVVANVALGVYGLTRLAERASPARAVELAVELGMDPATADETYGGASTGAEAAPTNEQLEEEWRNRRRNDYREDRG